MDSYHFMFVDEGGTRPSGELYITQFINDDDGWQNIVSLKSQAGEINPMVQEAPLPVRFQDTLYLFYNDKNTDVMRYIWRSGRTWLDQAVPRINHWYPLAANSPTPVVFRNVLYLFFNGKDRQHTHYITMSNNLWEGNRRVVEMPGGIEPGGGMLSPAACVYRDRIYLVVARRDLQMRNTLYLTTFNGTSWSPITDLRLRDGKLADKAQLDPSLTVYRDKLYLVYTANDNSDLKILKFDGTAWDQHGSYFGENFLMRPVSGSHDHKLHVIGYERGMFGSFVYDGYMYTHAANNYEPSRADHVTPQNGHFNVSPPYELPELRLNHKDWMRHLNDDLSIGRVNLPGSHDSAAFRLGNIHIYSCQRLSIPEQLESGIRLLDIRLKFSPKHHGVKIVTCHGDKGSYLSTNEYQDLNSVMNECQNFLNQNPSEFIVIILKVDDWGGHDANLRPRLYWDLQVLLHRFRIISTADLPNVGQCRNKIVLFNRFGDLIDADKFGPTFNWRNNTAGQQLPEMQGYRNFVSYVQDKYEDYGINGNREKINHVVAAYTESTSTADVIINFATGIRFGNFGLYINDRILMFFAKKSRRLNRCGWILTDYSTTEHQTNIYGKLDFVDVMVGSNFNYDVYPHDFLVDGKDDYMY